MRIVVVTTSYPANEGDPSGHFVRAEVAELERQGNLVRVVTPTPGGAFGWPGAATRLRAEPWRAFEALSWMARATSEVRRSQAELVVAHWSVPSGLAALAAPDAELELVSHGGDIRLLAALPERARTMVVDRLLGRATRWRFVSEGLFRDLTTVLDTKRRTHLEKLAVVGASPLSMVDVRAQARAQRHAIGKRRLFVCAGRLIPSKRVDKVIDYVAGQRQQHPVLVVVGDGPERRRLERLASRWMIDARFLGTLPHREALSWIGAADELVHASHAEGLSTVLREAEHLGIPITIL